MVRTIGKIKIAKRTELVNPEKEFQSEGMSHQNCYCKHFMFTERKSLCTLYLEKIAVTCSCDSDLRYVNINLKIVY